MKQILELFAQPAFLVSDGIVTWRNRAAAVLLDEGTPLVCVLEGHGVLYEHWDGEGKLQIPLSLNGESYDAVVCKTQEGELFVASESKTEWKSSAAAMLRASTCLRGPLQEMVTATDSLFQQIEATDENCEAAAVLNRTMYQMLRLCGQMADGSRLMLQKLECRKESTDLIALLTQFTDSLRPILERAGWHLRFVSTQTRIRADVDRALMERALYNLISNSLHSTPKGGTVTLSLNKHAQQIYVCVSDTGEGVAVEELAGMFQHMQEPLPTQRRCGLGMGLQMVREIARLHGGTMMLAANGEKGGTSVTFSLSTEQSALTVKSEGLRIDYLSGFQHSLVELADVLDAKHFDPREV